MTTEFVKTLLVTFLNFPSDINVIDWRFVPNTLTVKVETDDGMVSVYEFEGNWKGLAASPRVNNFDVVELD